MTGRQSDLRRGDRELLPGNLEGDCLVVHVVDREPDPHGLPSRNLGRNRAQLGANAREDGQGLGRRRQRNRDYQQQAYPSHGHGTSATFCQRRGNVTTAPRTPGHCRREQVFVQPVNGQDRPEPRDSLYFLILIVPVRVADGERDPHSATAPFQHRSESRAGLTRRGQMTGLRATGILHAR